MNSVFNKLSFTSGNALLMVPAMVKVSVVVPFANLYCFAISSESVTVTLTVLFSPASGES